MKETIRNDAYLCCCYCPVCGNRIYHNGKDRTFYCDECGEQLHHRAFTQEEESEAMFNHEMDEYED